MSIHRYWQPDFQPDRKMVEPLSAGEWAEAFREKLTETVRFHMRSDVPVGAWLSSGIDSSAVVALASRATTRPIQTVTLGFDDPTLDETRRFPTLDRFPGFTIANEVVKCGPSDFEMFAKALWHCEEPTHVMIPRLILGKAASKHVKVVLTGKVLTRSSAAITGTSMIKHFVHSLFSHAKSVSLCFQPCGGFQGGARRWHDCISPLPT